MELQEMTWPKVASLSKDTPIVIPIAALEQHGRHMPVFTDSMLLGEVLRRVKETPVKERVLFTPLMWLGNSHHHLDFPGTMTASPRVYMDLLIDMAENMIFHGFKRIVFVNGHGGNIVPVQQAMFELRQKLRGRSDLLLVSTTYWTLGGKPHEVDPNLKQGQVGHACEYETSMMLRLAPHLVVGDLSKIAEVPFGNAFAPATRAWITKDRTEPGHIGHPALASAEKGETIFRVFSADVAKFLERVLAWDGKSWEGVMAAERSTTWRYSVCGLLLCATMLNYMDRQTLSQLAKTICDEYGLSNERYGWLDTGFSLAFASGALFFGFVVDRLGPRWLYPGVLIGWSCAGLATAYADTIGGWFNPDAALPEQAYFGFMICRIVLGFFEAGHWPCALVTTQIIMSRSDRSFGNSILQSGAAIGAIVTPIIVITMITDVPGGWRPPFVVIGSLGIFWVVPWLLLIRGPDLDRRVTGQEMLGSAEAHPEKPMRDVIRMFAVLIVVVMCINITWQYFRVWLPKYLEETHLYTRTQVGWFTSAYYISTDVGCIGVGILVKWLSGIGWDVHRARIVTFTACAALTLLAVAVAFMPTGPWLLVLLLLVGMGALGFYPNYYSFTQELSRSHQGKISGALGTIAWIGSAIMQALVGRNIDETRSYATGIVLAGVAPLLACAALWLFFQRRALELPTAPETHPTSAPSTDIKEIPDQIRKA